jgi:hypothetical protein
MGHSLTAIRFFSDEIRIVPHTATFAKHLSRPVSIKEFAEGGPVWLFKRDDNGDYLVERSAARGEGWKEFIEGPEAK